MVPVMCNGTKLGFAHSSKLLFEITLIRALMVCSHYPLAARLVKI